MTTPAAVTPTFPQQDLHIRSLFGLQGKDALAALRGERVRTGGLAASPHVAPPKAGTALDSDERATLSSNDAQRDVEERIDVAPDLPTPDEDTGDRAP